MKRSTSKLIEQVVTIAAAAIVPWPSWASGEKTFKVAVIESVSLALLTAKAAFTSAPRDTKVQNG